MRPVQYRLCFLNRYKIAEGARYKRNVVINSLGNPDHRKRITTPPGLPKKLPASTLRAIASNGEDNIHPAPYQVFYSHNYVHRAPRGAEDRAAFLVDSIHYTMRQYHRLATPY